jgi:hypothetical protein
VSHRMTIDRFEGDRKQIAVLVTADGEQVNVPRRRLPKGSKAGDVLTLEIDAAAASPRVALASGDAKLAKDEAATEDVARKTRAVQEELKKSDPGGDLIL